MSFIKCKPITIVGIIFLMIICYLETIISFPFPMIFVIPGLIASMMIFAGNKKKGFALYAAFMLFFIAFYQLRHSVDIKNGEKAVDAIEKYYEVNKKYPLSLNDLIPEYMEEVPVSKTSWSKFKYIPVPKENRYHIDPHWFFRTVS